MKKYIISCGLLISSLFTQAQVTKGTLAVGGSLGLSSNTTKTKIEAGGTTTTTDGPRTTSFSVLPKVQYFFMDNVAIGAIFGYRGISTTSTSTSGGPTPVEIKTTNRVTGLVVAPYLRYHYMFAENFGVFGQAELPLFIGSILNKTQSGGTTTEVRGSQTNIGVVLSPGIVFFPTKNFGLEAKLGNLLGYNRSVDKTENSNTTTRFYSTQFDLLQFNSLTFNLGLAYYF